MIKIKMYWNYLLGALGCAVGAYACVFAASKLSNDLSWAWLFYGVGVVFFVGLIACMYMRKKCRMRDREIALREEEARFRLHHQDSPVWDLIYDDLHGGIPALDEAIAAASYEKQNWWDEYGYYLEITSGDTDGDLYLALTYDGKREILEVDEEESVAGLTKEEILARILSEIEKSVSRGKENADEEE